LLQGLAHDHEPGTDVLMALGCALFRSVCPGAGTVRPEPAAGVDGLEAAGRAFASALRQDPANPATRRNLSVVLGLLPEARARARRAEIMHRHKDSAALALASEMLSRQRGIVEDAQTAFTNESPTRIRAFEQLAARQRENAELWSPLEEKLERLGTPAPSWRPAADAMTNDMYAAARHLGDYDPAGYPLTRAAERALRAICMEIERVQATAKVPTHARPDRQVSDRQQKPASGPVAARQAPLATDAAGAPGTPLPSDERTLTTEAASRVLEKVLAREQAYNERRRARRQRASLADVDRDW